MLKRQFITLIIFLSFIILQLIFISTFVLSTHLDLTDIAVHVELMHHGK